MIHAKSYQFYRLDFMWPSLHTHYNDKTIIRNEEDESTFLSELSSVDAEKLIAIKHDRIGDNMPKTSNISVHQIHAVRVWIKKLESIIQE